MKFKLRFRFRKTLFVVLALLFVVQPSVMAEGKKASSPSPSSTMKVTFYSESLQQNMRLNVYLPANYEKKDKYPVLYLIHAYPHNEDFWFNTLNVTSKADELIAAGKLEPMIIVAPQIDNSWGINAAEKAGIWYGDKTDPKAWYEGMYEDFVAKDVVTYIDDHFKSNRSRDSRYIGGTSMGGYAALHIGLRNTKLFSKIGGHSPAVFLNDMWQPLHDWMYPTEQARNDRDPIRLAASEKLNNVSLYVDLGDQDNFKPAIMALDEAFRSNKTARSYQFHITPGGKHDESYWTTQVSNYLLFYGGNAKR
ncbi:alpha/beta hydrolase [Paenibacillus kobensis]|uniref:alpha/beta hydrolase n=1 Tax=Paenibacillus kobensis TaxID=59841 RepID=UPI000FDC5C11|nr:alpha/beta hydrolase-fold protein [Paenibacillus kobensis]